MRDPALIKIQIARKQTGIDDASYRALLQRVAGVDSSSSLKPSGCARVLAEFERLGWKAVHKRKKSDKAGVRLIFGLWTELGALGAIDSPTRAALLAFVKRQTGVDDPEWLTPVEVNTVVEGLKAMLHRAKKPRDCA